MIKFDKYIIDIAKIIHENNGTLYLVGGALRDYLLGISSNDYDFCVTGINFDKFKELFPESKIIGKDFPVFLLNNYEFALARKERKTSLGYLGFEIISNENITIKEDLKRRDITINAIAMEVLTGKIIDPFNGTYDLKNAIIRHISNSFIEDPLRAYRVARFAANFNFKIDNETLKLMTSLKFELSFLTPQRVFMELHKALKTPTPSIFFDVLKKTNLLDVHFKEISDLIDIPQPQKYHPEGDVYTHTMIVLDKVSKETTNEITRFCALTHDFGKASTPKEILPSHICHEDYGISIIENFCNKLYMPSIWKKKALSCCKYHMKAGLCINMRPYKLAKFINEVNKSAITLKELNIISNADDMLNRKKLQFGLLGKKMLQTINGKFLEENDITVKTVGIEQFNHLLLEKQATFLKDNLTNYIY